MWRVGDPPGGTGMGDAATGQGPGKWGDQSGMEARGCSRRMDGRKEGWTDGTQETGKTKMEKEGK